MDLGELDYALPEELIADSPPEERDGARLMVMERGGGLVRHSRIGDLGSHLAPSLVVMNDTRVIPARLHGVKPTGGKVEILLLERLSAPGPEERWRCMGRASKGLAVGTRVTVGESASGAKIEVEVVGGGSDATREVVLRAALPIEQALERVGEVPLPPYIRRAPRASDRDRYQTVYAARAGAVAAPTAGLHLSERLLDALTSAGHELAHVTLHVGAGTFAPVKAVRLEDHVMHSERYAVPAETAEAIARAKREGRAILAIGTTVVRTLEGVARTHGEVVAGEGETDIFITPGFDFRVVDALLTNFHLPRSTLLALVMAFAGIEPVRRAYAEAVRERYRFFSYGDAMLIRARGW
jgi:S-adenosylmethionine:tRNA ribosyltransferase-isomerase